MSPGVGGTARCPTRPAPLPGLRAPAVPGQHGCWAELHSLEVATGTGTVSVSRWMGEAKLHLQGWGACVGFLYSSQVCLKGGPELRSCATSMGQGLPRGLGRGPCRLKRGIWLFPVQVPAAGPLGTGGPGSEHVRQIPERSELERTRCPQAPMQVLAHRVGRTEQAPSSLWKPGALNTRRTAPLLTETENVSEPRGSSHGNKWKGPPARGF